MEKTDTQSSDVPVVPPAMDKPEPQQTGGKGRKNRITKKRKNRKKKKKRTINNKSC